MSRGEFVQTRRSKMHRNAVGKTRINALVTFKPHYKRDTRTYTNIHNVLKHTHTHTDMYTSRVSMLETNQPKIYYI